jgi:hypothetical protein
MRKGFWVRRASAASAGVVLLLWLCGCGGSADVAITKLCDGDAGGLQIKGVVEMPNGRIAHAPGAWQRVAGTLWSAAAAISASVSPIATGQLVELVELRAEDLANGTDPGPVGTTGRTVSSAWPARRHRSRRLPLRGAGGQPQRRHADARLRVQHLEPIDIDFRSEATVRAILSQIPPARLCDFSPDEIRDLRRGRGARRATGSNADESTPGRHRRIGVDGAVGCIQPAADADQHTPRRQLRRPRRDRRRRAPR